MATIFILKGFNPSESIAKIPIVEAPTIKPKYDVVNPGKVINANSAGGQVRVLQRGEVFDKDGNVYDRECGKPCWYHRTIIRGLAMGCPVRVTRQNKQLRIFMDGFFCSYSCALAFINEDNDKLPSKRNPNYNQSRTLLLQLFAEEFPGEKLVPALDWKLRKDVGNGNMSDSEWATGLKGIRVIPHPNLIYSAVTVSNDVITVK